MESASTGRPKLRKRSKSILAGTDVHTESPSDDSIVNLNGEDDESVKADSKGTKTVSDNIDTVDTENDVEEKPASKKPAKGRKRKASEMKQDDSSSTDETMTKEKSFEDKEVKDDIAEKETEQSQDQLDDKDKDESSANESSSEIKILDKQSLGKGKRARIPNKRYSDFPLRSPKHGLVENGETKENFESGSNSDTSLKYLSEDLGSGASSPNANVASKARTSQTNSPSTPAAKKPKPSINLSNPNYLKPFKFGWKRELVYRATGDSNKRNADIYYYTPNGKKVRSMREVSENLKNKELVIDDFTFFKEALGLDDPEKEIIRDAKVKAGSATPAKKIISKVAKTPKSSPRTSSVSVPPSEDLIESKPSKAPTQIKVKMSRMIPSNKAKAEKKPNKDKDKEKEKELEVATYPPNWSSPATTKKAAKTNLSDVDKPRLPCSIRCEGILGIIPTLQCHKCLCLYHYECVGLTLHSNVPGYICKNCQLDQETDISTTVAPPPLTPINALKSVVTQSPTVLPKLQRIPRSDDSPEQSSVTPDVNQESLKLPPLKPRPLLPNISKFAKAPETANTIENKSIVGSVTTWFPSSSTIQVTPAIDSTSTTKPSLLLSPRPQLVEMLGSKTFIIVPKHNVVSVSPTVAVATASVPCPKTVNNNVVESSSMLGFVNKVAAEGTANASSTLDSASLGPSVHPNASEEPKIKTESHSLNHPSDPTSNNSEFIEENMEVDKSNDEMASGENVDPNLKNEGRESSGLGTPAKKSKRSSNLKSTIVDAGEDIPFMEKYLQHVAYGYNTLLYVFQYLKVQDLLRASCVCAMWRDIASHPILWRTVRMKNSQIHNFEGLADALRKHNTTHLDLRKMLLPSNSSDDIWEEFSRVIKKVESLKKIELCRCPAAVVEQLAVSNPNLTVINAVTIKCESINLDPLSFSKNLQELRLKSITGFSLNSDLTALSGLNQLKHLSLTSIKDLNKLNIEVIADLVNLESLDLGECADFPKTFGSEILSKLTKLEKLRLEKGQGNCYTFELLDAVKEMESLEQLELVNFDIKPGFDKALGSCTNVKKLLIIPTYISQSATTNHMVLGGVLRLQSTLSHFVWGVTLELLRVTELFVDQCEDPDKKEKKDKKPVGNGDSIPVLKPVPLLKGGINLEILPAQDPPQVEILPLPNLQKLLLQSLPSTRVKILKIPFHATWRQSITDTVN